MSDSWQELASSRIAQIKKFSTVSTRFKALPKEYRQLAKRFEWIGATIRHNTEDVGFQNFLANQKIESHPERMRNRLSLELELGIAGKSKDKIVAPVYCWIAIGSGPGGKHYGDVSLRLPIDERSIPLITCSLEDAAFYSGNRERYLRDSFLLEEWSKAAALKTYEKRWPVDNLSRVISNLAGVEYLEVQLFMSSIPAERVIEACVYCDNNSKPGARDYYLAISQHPEAWVKSDLPYPIFVFG